MVRVVKVNSFTEIEKEWGYLLKHNSGFSYYQSVPYMRVLWSNILPYCLVLRVVPRFFLFSENGEIKLILPLFKKLFKNEYTLYGYRTGVGYLDAIYSDELRLSDFSNCFYELKNYIKGSIIRFEHVRYENTLGKWLLMNGGHISEKGCTEIVLPDCYDEYYQSLGKHMKQNIRTSYNRLDTDKCQYVFKCKSYSGMPGDLSKKLNQMYITRQISKYKKSKLYSYFVKYIDLGTRIHKSSDLDVRAFILLINNQIASYFDAIIADKVIIVPRLAISDTFNRYSPGVILINESIKHLVGQGIKSMDLTHGTEAYKLSMGGVVHNCVEATIKFERTLNFNHI